MSDDSLYGFGVDLLDGSHLNLGVFQGLPLLICNLGSTGGHRQRISELEQLHRSYSEMGLTVLGVPSNDFDGEHGDLDRIRARYTYDFRATFLVTLPQRVGGARPCPLYRALTRFGNRPVKSDAETFVVDGEGYVSERFGPETGVRDPAMLAALKFVLPTLGY